MAKEQIGSNAQFTGTGKGLTITGDYGYGYSGQVTTSSSTEMVLLNFNTGSYVLKTQITMAAFGVSNEDFKYKIKFNGLDVNEIYYIDTYKSYTNDARDFYYIIPPFTNVLITGNSVGGTEGIIGCLLTGRVLK